MTPDPDREAVEAMAQGRCRRHLARFHIDGAELDNLVEIHWKSHVVECQDALAALREAGFVVVPREPTPEAVAAWWRIKNGHHFADEAPPTDTSDYAAYRALVRAAAGEPPR